jgi:hypothetical protein
MVGHTARTGEMRNTYRILVGKLKGKDQLGDLLVEGRLMSHQILNTECEVDWMHLVQDRDQWWAL